jgi:heme A synthase
MMPNNPFPADPAAPIFSASLFPYLLFLWWAWRSRRMPTLALWGFALTLLFVLITIVAAVVARLNYGEELANVDSLHGGAEAFLSLSNLVLLLGFSGEQVLRKGATKASATDDQAGSSIPRPETGPNLP